jgi:hypothetical protein
MEKARDDGPCLYRVALLSQRVPLNLSEKVVQRVMKLVNRTVEQIFIRSKIVLVRM